jgi:hypothetical protein
MIFSSLTASGFKYNSVFYNAEFEDLLAKIIACYSLMIEDKVVLRNDENSIRDVLLINYLKNDEVRNKIGLTGLYLFDREVPEDMTIGRTDIKVQTPNSFITSTAYYTLECKRINALNQSGKTGLNAKYIKNGVCRFSANTYSSYHQTNGMIGFVVVKMDIHKNITHLNKLLQTFNEANTTKEMRLKNVATGFEYCYCSLHTVEKNEISIYHLMLDVSGNVS